MKKQLVILIFSITASLFSLTSCGKTTGAEESSSIVTTEPTTTVSPEAPTSTESVVYTPDPTTTPTPTPTPTVTPDPTASPTSDPSSSSEYMTDEMRESLKTLGATDDEIAAIKSEKDMTDLVDKLITGGGTTGNSSTTTGGSSSSDTGSSGSIGDEVYDPSRDFQLLPDDGSLHGSM